MRSDGKTQAAHRSHGLLLFPFSRRVARRRPTGANPESRPRRETGRGGARGEGGVGRDDLLILGRSDGRATRGRETRRPLTHLHLAAPSTTAKLCEAVPLPEHHRSREVVRRRCTRLPRRRTPFVVRAGHAPHPSVRGSPPYSQLTRAWSSTRRSARTPVHRDVGAAHLPQADKASATRSRSRFR